MKKVQPNQQQLDLIIENAKTGEMSISKLSSHINLHRTVIKRIIKEHNLKDLYDTHKKRGKQRQWTDEEIYQLSLFYDDRRMGIREIAIALNRSKDDVLSKASYLGLKKKKKLDITTEQIIDIQNCGQSIQDITILANKYGLTVEGMRLRIKRVNEGYKKRREFIEFPKQLPDDLRSVLENYKLTANEVSDITGYSPYKIQAYRRELDDFQLKKDYNSDFSYSEIQCLRILEDLDFAFIPHKRIDNYIVDFYLGHKTYIEIQGYNWHSTDEQFNKDALKKEYLEQNGYVGLYIYDYELTDVEKIKQRIIKIVAHNKPRELLENP